MSLHEFYLAELTYPAPFWGISVSYFRERIFEYRGPVLRNQSNRCQQVAYNVSVQEVEIASGLSASFEMLVWQDWQKADHTPVLFASVWVASGI